MVNGDWLPFNMLRISGYLYSTIECLSLSTLYSPNSEYHGWGGRGNGRGRGLEIL